MAIDQEYAWIHPRETIEILEGKVLFSMLKEENINEYIAKLTGLAKTAGEGKAFYALDPNLLPSNCTTARAYRSYLSHNFFLSHARNGQVLANAAKFPHP